MNSSSHQVTKILEFQLQNQSFQWMFRTASLKDWLLWSPSCPGDSQVFSNTTVQKHQFFGAQLYSPTLTFIHGKTIALTRWTFVGKVMSLLFNKLSRLVKAFLPRGKCLLVSWLQSPSAVNLEPKKIKSLTVTPSICYEVMGWDGMILVFWMLSFKPSFSLFSFTFIKKFFSFSLFSAARAGSSAYLRLLILIFLLAILIPVCASSSPAFQMMYSACKLNK